MKTVGIISEYDPFHNGHKYQIDQAKKQFGCDAVVCVMSGSFVQRGDIALFDKWSRAKAALVSGADLVIELPAWYVLQSADMFAYGAVELLKKSHLADALSFGSESGCRQSLLRLGEILADENEDFKTLMEKLMSAGSGYPSALRECIKTLYPELESITSNPNDMLGASYISAMLRCGASFDIIPVLRHTSPHDSTISDGVFASSSAIRDILKTGGDASALTPSDTSAPKYRIENIESFILGFLRSCDPDRIRSVPGTEDGFENRLISAAQKSCTLSQFYDLAVSKRYSLSRVRRTVLAAITGMEKNKHCDYVRILGMTDTGARLLKEASEKSELTFVTKTADFTPGHNSVFCYDIAATDIASLACDVSGSRSGGMDFYNSPVKI